METGHDARARSHGPGPLAGTRVVELGGIGPVPFAGMILAEMGADVVRVDRPGQPPGVGVPPAFDLLNRGKRSIALDLKQQPHLNIALRLASRAEVVLEGFRPGVAERLGIGPSGLHALNPAVVYGRMTGWGQDGPMAQLAGHDINYIAVAGALHAIGPAGGAPQIPLNLVGDFGGGATYLVMGVLAALLDAPRSGVGRVVDAAIVDGVAHLLACTWSFINAGIWADQRGVNRYDGGSPYYAVYETSDSRHLAVGATERKFYAQLLRTLGLDHIRPEDQDNLATWPATRAQIGQAIRSADLAHWKEVFEKSDACVAPVLALTETHAHPHMRARGSLIESNGQWQPAPAPRFSGGQSLPAVPPAPGQHTAEILAELGMDAGTVELGTRLGGPRPTNVAAYRGLLSAPHR